MVSYLIANDKIVLLLNNKQYQVLKEDENYQKVVDGITAGLSADKLEELAKPKGAAVVSYLAKNNDGDITICGNSVLFKGQEIKNPAVTRLLAFVRDKLPIGPLKLFLTKLYSNPSHASIQALYDFLEHKNLPITEDGDFLAYKAVRDNYKDKHSGTIDNHVGAVVEMPRNAVDDERDNHCSAGLHAGAMEYVSGFKGPNDIILIVKINPADVVSVPKDCNCTKLRCCRYEVVAHYDGDLTAPLYTDKAEEVDYDDEEVNDGWDDEEEDENWEADQEVCEEDCDCELDCCLKDKTELPEHVKNLVGQGYEVKTADVFSNSADYIVTKNDTSIFISYIKGELANFAVSTVVQPKSLKLDGLLRPKTLESYTVDVIGDLGIPAVSSVYPPVAPTIENVNHKINIQV